MAFVWGPVRILAPLPQRSPVESRNIWPGANSGGHRYQKSDLGDFMSAFIPSLIKKINKRNSAWWNCDNFHSRAADMFWTLIWFKQIYWKLAVTQTFLHVWEIDSASSAEGWSWSWVLCLTGERALWNLPRWTWIDSCCSRKSPWSTWAAWVVRTSSGEPPHDWLQSHVAVRSRTGFRGDAGSKSPAGE